MLVRVVILSIITLVVRTHAFQVVRLSPQFASRHTTQLYERNTYDEWRADVPVDTMPLEEEFVQMCLEDMIYSDYGEQMFGVHDQTGTILYGKKKGSITLFIKILNHYDVLNSFSSSFFGN